MDLGFNRFDKHAPVSVLPADLAVLLVQASARQAASPTAAADARCAPVRIEAPLLAPPDGAFNGSLADRLRKWKDE